MSDFKPIPIGVEDFKEIILNAVELENDTDV